MIVTSTHIACHAFYSLAKNNRVPTHQDIDSLGPNAPIPLTVCKVYIVKARRIHVFPSANIPLFEAAYTLDPPTERFPPSFCWCGVLLPGECFLQQPLSESDPSPSTSSTVFVIVVVLRVSFFYLSQRGFKFLCVVIFQSSSSPLL